MIFQEPMTALNPVYTIGFQIAEMLRSHQAMSPKAARQRAIELLDAGRDPRARAARRRLPAPAVRRAAAAGDDRPGAGLRPEAADRRRADDGARRHGAGRDPQADARPARPHRRRHRADHPRHGRRRRPGRPRDRDAARAGSSSRAPPTQVFNDPQHPYTQQLLARGAAPRVDRRRDESPSGRRRRVDAPAVDAPDAGADGPDRSVVDLQRRRRSSTRSAAGRRRSAPSTAST